MNFFSLCGCTVKEDKHDESVAFHYFGMTLQMRLKCTESL
jgi:hypothetical protein